MRSCQGRGGRRFGLLLKARRAGPQAPLCGAILDQPFPKLLDPPELVIFVVLPFAEVAQEGSIAILHERFF